MVVRLAVCVAIVLIPWAASAQQDVFPQRVYTIGDEPVDLAVGDLDGDGHPDIVTVSEFRPYFSVLLGIAGGGFKPERRVSTGTNGSQLLPLGVAIADFDGDSIADVALRFRYSVGVWKGVGDGTFDEGASYPVFSWQRATLAAGDFNADGRADIVAGGEPMSVLVADDDGGFSISSLPDSGGFAYVVAGDFNGDGNLDFVASHSGKVWLGEGDGTFTWVPRSSGGRDALAHDFNQDGHLDLALVRSQWVEIQLGQGNGQFSSSVSYDVLPPGDQIAHGDLNRDGLADLIVTGFSAAHASVLISNGDGTFNVAVTYPTPLSGGAVASRDFNGDGVADAAVASWLGSAGPVTQAKTGAVAEQGRSSAVFVLGGDGQGGLIGEHVDLFAGGDYFIQQLSVADFNGDGLLDLASANSLSDDVSILLGGADGAFTGIGSEPAGSFPVSLVAAYFDVGTTIDLAVANEGSSDISILLGDGSGGFFEHTTIALDSPPAEIVAADLNGDGTIDLVTTHPSAASVNVLLGQGDGTFSPPFVVPVGTAPRALIVADLDGVGGVDLAITEDASGVVYVLSGNGDGTFSAKTEYPLGTTMPTAIVVADLDGDGRQDLAVSAYSDPSLVVLYGLEGGGLSGPTPLDVGSSALDLAVADFDGDGRPDLITSHVPALVSVCLQRGNGFEQCRSYAANRNGRLAVADFTGDGLPDAVVGSGSARSFAFLPNRTPIHIRFETDKETLTWPQLLGVDSYGIYRGDISSLQDTLGGGLPDDGYGDCRSDLDPDPTDAMFMDEQTPESGGGFFYLMSQFRGNVESGLGTTSGGFDRVPATPCLP